MEENSTETDETTSSSIPDNTTMNPDSNELTLLTTELDSSANSTVTAAMEETSTETNETTVWSIINSTITSNYTNSTDTDIEESSTESNETTTSIISDVIVDSKFFGIPQPVAKINGSANLTLFNYTDPETRAFGGWYEVSDTDPSEGRSVATLTRYELDGYLSGFFFYLIDLHPSEHGFIVIEYELNSWNLSDYQGVMIDLKRYGPHTHFRLMFYNNCSDTSLCHTYESTFKTSGNREQVQLPFTTFHAYYGSIPEPDSPPLDITQLSGFGILAYNDGGIEVQQTGPGAVELFSVVAYK
ncbi:unnamed protein product [Schistosoma turkestanicum]|nr:unnamed protein product [Schistosoma turkestanicum]